MFGFGNSKHFLRLGTLCLTLFVLTTACQPSAPEGEISQDDEAVDATGADSSGDVKIASPSKARRPDFLVRFAASERANDFSALRLVSAISYLEFSVTSCASGYSVSGLGAATQSFNLYRFDQGCQAKLDRFTINGQVFTISAGQTFNGSLNAVNSFTGNLGKIVQVKVVKQLPQILDTVDADVNFLITENNLGADVSLVIYQVGISVSPSSLTEGDVGPALFLVKRASPAVGSLTVNLNVTGTATPGVDTSSVPSSVVLLDGQATTSFTVSALNDADLEPTESLTIGIGMGAYDPDPNLATVDIENKIPWVAPTWNSLVGSVSVQEATPLNIAVNANNPNVGDSLSYAIDSARSSCVTGWSPALSINASGVVYGIADDPAIGTCLLVVTASNSIGSISQDINVTVTNLPELPVWSQTYATSSLFDAEALDLTFAATDPDPGAALVYSLDPSSTCSSASWTVAPTVAASTGRVTGTPSSNSVGACTIVVKATSQGDVISSTLYVTVSKRTFVWTAPAGITVNACVPLSVSLGDGMGRIVNAPSAFTLSMIVNNGTGAFYSNATCTTAITTKAWLINTNNVSFYFKSTTASQNLTLVATNGTYDPGVANVSIGSSATKLLVTGPSTVATGQCVKFRVDQTDANGIKIATAVSLPLTLTWLSTLSAFTNASCDNSLYNPAIPAWDSGLDVYLLGVSVGSGYLNAAAAALTSMQLTVNVTSSRVWWNSSWGYRSRIQVDNLDQATTFTNQPILLRLTPQRLDYSRVKADGSDLRFIASDNSTDLPYQIQQWVPNGTSLVWVKVNSIAASSSQSFFYMYYANGSATDPATSSQVWTDYNYVYHLNESPTGAAPQYKDSTASANHGTAVASPTSSLGPNGTCASFMGNRDYINMTNNLAPVLGATATFSAWVKTSQVGQTLGWNSPAITGVEFVGNTNDIQYGWIDNTGKIGVTAGDGAAAKSNFVVNDNAWRHVTITRQSSNGAVKFYVNGVQNGTGTSEAGVKTTAFKQIGMLWDSGGNHRNFDGLVGEVRIFTGVMTAARIRADYKYQLDSYLSYKEVEAY